MLWLSLFKNITLKTKLQLLSLFKTAENIYCSSEHEFYNKGFYDKKTISIILNNRYIYNVIDYKKILDKKEISFVHINEVDYPYLLKNIFDPPILLYYKGTLPNKNSTLISVVGTRTPSDYGISATTSLVSGLVKEGIGIVSGLAYGIDTIANSTAINNKGYTIAVLGCGIDMCYPKTNIGLMNKIATDGLVLSEYALGEKAIPSNFPERNRIIAGLSQATLITESPIKGGSIITANIALNEGRDVMSIPADIFRNTSKGNNELIKLGAIPITETSDILFAINFVKENTDNSIISSNTDSINNIKSNNNLTKEEQKLLKLFSYEGITTDELISKSGLEVQTIMSLLTMLEVKEFIIKLQNQRFILNKN